MALPKIKHSLHPHTLTNGKTIHFRGFTNQEQKILLQAKGMEDSATAKEDIINAVSQIINNCTEGKVDAKTLPTFDVEELFLRIRSKSVGEVVNLKYRYDYDDEDGVKQSEFIEVQVNLDDVKISHTEGHDNKIQLTPDVGIVLKYPTFEIAANAKTDDDVVLACIDSIYTAEEIFDPASYSRQELEEFYNDIDAAGLIKISKFFETMPKLKHEVEVELPGGKKQTITFEGLESFFT